MQFSFCVSILCPVTSLKPMNFNKLSVHSFSFSMKTTIRHLKMKTVLHFHFQFLYQLPISLALLSFLGSSIQS